MSVKLFIHSTPFSRPQKLPPGAVEACECVCEAVFFFYFRFMTVEGQTDVWQEDISQWPLEFTVDMIWMLGERQWQSDSLIKLIFLWNGNNLIHHDNFPVSHSLSGCCFSKMYGACLMLSMLYLFMWGQGGVRSREPESGIIEVRASVYVCVWVSFSLFSLVPTTASSFKLFTTPLSSFTFLLVYLSSKSVPVKPVPRSLSLYTPASLCLCSSLDLGAVCLDAEEEENLSGGTQLGGAPRLGRKSACGTGSRTFRWN